MMVGQKRKRREDGGLLLLPLIVKVKGGEASILIAIIFVRLLTKRSLRKKIERIRTVLVLRTS